MIPLGITSIAGMTAILYKFLSLSRSRVIPRRARPRGGAISRNSPPPTGSSRVLKEFEKGDSTLARLAAVAVKHRGKPQRDITLAVEVRRPRGNRPASTPASACSTPSSPSPRC